MRGLRATALAPVATALIQLGTVPLLLHIWGPAKYGDWLVISALPTYLSLSDMGFGNASGSDMTYRVAQGDRDGALRTFQSSWLLLTLISLIALAFVAATVWLVPWHRCFGLLSLSDSTASTVMLTLAAFAILTQQNSVLESGFRCDGDFAIGTSLWTAQRVAEACVANATALMGGSLISVAVAYLLTRSIGTVCYAAILFRRNSWLRLGFQYAKLSAVRDLIKPAAGFVALPVGQALSLQGFTVIIAAQSGPVAVTAFSTARALTRVSFQLANAIARAVWPELSTAFGSGNFRLARRLHRHACQASFAISVVTALALLTAGPWLYRTWTHDTVRLDATCFKLLLIVSVTSSFWNTSSIVPMSTNSHQPIAVLFSVVSLLSLGMAWVLIPSSGIAGAALCLLLIDTVMSWVVLRAALLQVKETYRGFIRTLFTGPSLVEDDA